MSRIAGLLIVAYLFMLLALSGTAFCAEAGYKPHFSVRLLGGLSYQSIDDLNSGSTGLSDLMRLLVSGGGQYGDIQSVHFGLDLGVDLIYQFSPYLGIGVGAGFLHASKKSEIQFIEERPPYRILDRFTIEPEVSVVPITANLYLFVPLGSFLKLSLNTGPALYIASVSQDVRTEYTDWWWHQQEKASGGGFGFLAGIGLEARLSSKISLIVEAQGRYAKVGGLTGSHRYVNSRGDQETVEGTLYYWANSNYGTYRIPHMTFPLVGVQSSFPSGSYISSAREAVLDLRGASVVAGLVFRF